MLPFTITLVPTAPDFAACLTALADCARYRLAGRGIEAVRLQAGGRSCWVAFADVTDGPWPTVEVMPPHPDAWWHDEHGDWHGAGDA